MIIRCVYILLIVLFLGGVGAWMLRAPNPDAQTSTQLITSPVSNSVVDVERNVERYPQPAVVDLPISEPEPEPEPLVVAEEIEEPVEEITSQKDREFWQYYERAQARFLHESQQLENEQNEARRKRLIQTLARYVRMDTLSAIEWAMSLEDPEEQRLAMEAINKNALTGIGARIEVDETGLPRIEDTTVMSAIKSTGIVETGDHIEAMADANGNPIYFKDLSVREIVELLRGQAGTDVTLYMLDANGQPYEVSFPRTMIVMPPPI